MNRRWHVTALGAALAACGAPANLPLTELDLNRPVDIAFACYGGMRVTNGSTTADPAADILTTAQPTDSCDQRSTLTPTTPLGQEDNGEGSKVPPPSWYGFILQSAQGTIAVASWDSKPATAFTGGSSTLGGDVQVLDADPLTPGKNAISVGEEPIAIATDKAGCFEVTANAGSCDLSELSINDALGSITPVPGRPPARVQVGRVPVKTPTGAILLSKPTAMAAEPGTTIIGNTCPATATGLVYIAYPSCHLVAGVDVSSGKVVTGIQYNATGQATILSGAALDTLTCPAECFDATTATSVAAATPGPRPVTLALEATLDNRVAPPAPTRRLAIGADNAASVTVVDLDTTTSLPMALTQVALQNTTGKLGVTAIALSPQIGMGGLVGESDDTGTSGGQGQYVYAVATDSTVRVADVLNLNKECDTQVDTRFLRTIFDIRALQCFPVGDPATPQRRSGAKGPGIELVGDAVPISVAFVKAPKIPPLPPPNQNVNQQPTGPGVLLGYFAIVTASNGQSFVVDVDDDNNAVDDHFVSSQPETTAPTLVIAHQLRDGVSARDAVPTATISEPNPTDPTHPLQVEVPVCNAFTPNVAGTGGPHAIADPTNNVVVGSLVSVAKAQELPSIQQVECKPQGAPGEAMAGMSIPVSELQISADLTVRDPVFPDLRNLFNDESWTLTWEGPLSQDSNFTAVDGPSIREAQMVVDSTAQSRIVDNTHPFCAMGVEPFDILQMRGCNPLNGNADCPSGYECYLHPEAAVGTCMLQNEATRLVDACRDYFISLRRYTVASTTSGELVVQPRKHELRTTPLDGCTDDFQCTYLSNYAAQNASDQVSVTVPRDKNGNLTPDVNAHTWACIRDDARAPINPDPAKNKRCVQTCAYHSMATDQKDRDVDYDLGTICQGASPSQAGICMESVMPPQACVNGPQQFDVRASEAFTVIGTQSGYVHPIVEVGGACKPDPTLGPSSRQLQVGRLPLKAPACGDPATTDPITGALAGGGFEPNPCSLTAPQAEYQTTCSGSTTSLTPMFERRGAPAIKLRTRGMTLTMVDPYYPGDQMCPLDRKGLSDPSVANGVARIPLVYPGYQLAFRQVGGYTPLTLSGFNPAFPVKVVRGPSDSIWIIDDGDFLSINGIDPSTSGKVFRIESTSLGTINTLE